MASDAGQLDSIKTMLPEPLGEQLLDHARLITLKSGQILIGHQDDTKDVFVVLDGSLQVELHSLNGKEIILANVPTGGLVGEFAALDDQPRSATVTATTKCTLARIPGGAFKEKILGNPGTAEWLATRLVTQIRGLTERVFELNSLAVRSRLHCEMLRLSLDAGVDGNEALISPSPTHAQMANRIGTHREAVTRELQYLQQQGIAQQAGRKLTVTDVVKLAEIVRAAAGDSELIQRANHANIGRTLD